jgi:glycosyltransferase involved in cell wall biosynthesis
MAEIAFDTPPLLRIVCLAGLDRDGGISEALRGVKLARSRGIKLNAVIAGRAPACRPNEGASPEPEVVFAGSLAGKSKAALLANSDVMLLPADPEGRLFTLLEAMAAGVAVVAARVGAIPEIVVDGVHGLLVAPRDPEQISMALVRLAHDPVLLSRMREQCRRYVSTRYPRRAS